MATLRDLKGRIASVASSEKITGAMKMISSAKMHKAEGALRRLVPFRSQIETIIANLLSSDAEFDSPLVNAPAETRNVLLLVWGSDEGLCGAYNVNIYKQVVARISDLRARFPQATITVCPIGHKLAGACSRMKVAGVKVVASTQDLGYEFINSKSEGEDVNNFTDAIVKNNDQVVTTGSTLYPRGLLLGYITNASLDETGVAKYATLEPSCDLGKLEQIAIITQYDLQ